MGVEYQQSGLIKNFYLLTEKFAVYLLSVAGKYHILCVLCKIATHPRTFGPTQAIAEIMVSQSERHKGVNNLFVADHPLTD